MKSQKELVQVAMNVNRASIETAAAFVKVAC